MKFFLLFVAAVPATLAAALMGLGHTGGKDIGFAGAGLWFAMAPIAVLGLATGLIARKFASRDAVLAGTVFFATACAASFAYAALGLKALMYGLEMAGAEPEYEYVPAADNLVRITIRAPADVGVGEAFPVTATRDWGERWQKVPWRGGPRYGRFVHGPPKFEQEAAGQLQWKTEPALENWWPLRPPGSPGAFFEIKQPGVYRVWAEMNYPVEARSNVVVVTVRQR